MKLYFLAFSVECADYYMFKFTLSSVVVVSLFCNILLQFIIIAIIIVVDGQLDAGWSFFPSSCSLPSIVETNTLIIQLRIFSAWISHFRHTEKKKHTSLSIRSHCFFNAMPIIFVFFFYLQKRKGQQSYILYILQHHHCKKKKIQ